MFRNFDITDIVDRVAIVAKERGLELGKEWRKGVIARLKTYAKTVNPFNKFIKPMFGVMQDRRNKNAVFMYGINPNARYDDTLDKPGDIRMPSPAYHVKLEGRNVHKYGWKTLDEAQVHEKDIGSIVEYGLSNFFTYREYTYGITAGGNVESAHSTKNIAEIIFNSPALDRILLEAAEDVVK